ncbi:phosphotransferase [Actinopolymorpha sp. NPDC004070]|uniref:phosphotransferase n=1 Tax=Actinopolymorpha sp. NPDC004070 TaxID=3154548 RepID=UPI0033B57422
MNEILPGGFHSAPVRKGEVVERRAGPWTPKVHALLRHLRRSGFGQAPAPVAVSEDGRIETLGFVGGEGGTYPLTDVQRSGEALVNVALAIRAMHDATAGFVPPDEGSWQVRTSLPSEIDCIGHNDLGPYNLVYRGAEVAAIIDWDFAGPSSRAWDLCYAAHRFVPLSAPRSTRAFGWDPVPDQAARLRTFAIAYGGDIPPARLLDLLVVRLGSIAATIEREVRAGNPAYDRQRDERHTDGYREDIAYVLANRAALLG